MSVFVLFDPGDSYSYGEEMDIKVFQTKERLYKYILEQIEAVDVDPDAIESANLYFAKGDYEALKELYEDTIDTNISVLERTIIK